MPVLDEGTREEVRRKLSGMKEPVTALFFYSRQGCEYCPQAKELMETLASLSPKIMLESYDLGEAPPRAAEYGIDKAPAIVLHGREKRFIRFFGFPGGYEFATLMARMLDISLGRSHLGPDLARRAKGIDFPVHIEVLVTTTCPHCPAAVHVAHDLAAENPNIRADMVEAVEFPELSRRYEVSGVPHTVINGKGGFTGALAADTLLMKVLELKKQPR